MKTCSKCNQEKELNQFHKSKIHSQGKHSICKKCRSSSRSVMNEMFHNSKKRAKERGIRFEITLEDLKNLNSQQAGLCSYTKQPLNWGAGNCGKQRVCPPSRASLDRIDSNGGYTPNNIQLTWDIVNRMKSHYTHNEFIEACRLITQAN